MTISNSVPPEWGDMAGAPMLKLQRVGVTVPSLLGGEMSVVLAANFPDAPDDWVIIHAPLDKLVAAIHKSQTEIASAVRREQALHQVNEKAEGRVQPGICDFPGCEKPIGYALASRCDHHRFMKLPPGGYEAEAERAASDNMDAILEAARLDALDDEGDDIARCPKCGLDKDECGDCAHN